MRGEIILCLIGIASLISGIYFLSTPDYVMETVIYSNGITSVQTSHQAGFLGVIGGGGAFGLVIFAIWFNRSAAEQTDEGKE